MDDDCWFTVAELSTYSTLHQRTIRRHMASRTNPLPHHKVGGRVVIRKSEYDAWVCGGGGRAEPTMDERVDRALLKGRG